MNRRWQIGCYLSKEGTNQVAEYISSLNNIDDLEKIINGIGRLSRVGQNLIDTKMVKHINGPIFELRKDRHRIMFSEDYKNNRFVLLSAFFKRTKKTPLEEIDRANNNWSEYLSFGKCEIFAVPFDDF